MRVLLIGYTGCEPNPGCQATSDGLLNLLRETGASTIDLVPLRSIPLGFTRRFFGEVEQSSSRNVLLNWLDWPARRYFGLRQQASWSGKQATISERWHAALQALGDGEEWLTQRMQLADLVVVNAEGVIHHNAFNGLVLLAWGHLAISLGKRTWFVNGTYQEMDQAILTSTMAEAEAVVVREPMSQRYLQSLGLQPRLAADCAFYANYDNTSQVPNLPEEIDPQLACCITTGVSGGSDQLEAVVGAVRDAGLQPFYLAVAPNDAARVSACRKLRVPAVGLESVPWRLLPRFLGQTRLLLSGRHHINIFSLCAQHPFVPLTSNTWKIEGTCELLDYHVDVPTSREEITAAIRVVLESYNGFVDQAARAAKQGRQLAWENVRHAPRESPVLA